MPYTTVIIFNAFDPLAAADLNSNFSNLDYLNNKINSQIIIPASAMYPRSTNPARAGTVELASNLANYVFMDFPDTGGATFAEFILVMPSDYNGGTLTAQFYWTANSTSGNSVVWGIYGVCMTDDEALDAAVGPSREVADANKTTAYDLNVTSVTDAIPLAGTPAAGELARFRVFRSSGSASDTLAATARLIAVVLNYTRS